jgi:Tfp pilus assembly protein PilN
VKRDLNLIPRAEAQSSANKYILPIVLIVVLYAATAYLAITIPRQRLQAKEDSYAVLKQKIADLAYVEAEYLELRQKLAEVEAKKQTILQTMHSEKDSINILSLVEQACPEEIVLTDVVITPKGIIIVGNSQNDVLVAEFMVNLRAMELFAASNISRVEPADTDYFDVQEALAGGYELPELRKFRLVLTYAAEET